MSKIFLVVLAVAWIRSTGAQDICKSPKPDFTAPGRRISEQKCHEYNWERKKVEQCTPDGGVSEYPYMGAVAHRVNGIVNFFCSSILVSPKYAVTAAHCAKGTKNSVLDFIRFGIKNVKDEVKNIDVKVVKTTTHPQHKEASLSYDIAILELETELPITRAVMPMCLWSAPEDTKQSGVVPGWAKTEADGDNLDNRKTLRAMKVQAMDRETCLATVERWYNRRWRQLEDHQMCVNETENGMNTLCQGLSGAPFVVQVPLDGNPSDVMPYAVSFSQFGPSTCSTGISIYIRASSFVDWIESVVWPAK